MADRLATTAAPSPYSGLIERLEERRVSTPGESDGRGGYYSTWEPDDLCVEAAQAIRNLEADNARLREALTVAKEAMVWAEAHVGGHTKYETAQQVVNCLEKHEDALAVVVAALSGSDRP